jgi:hypothetical protein
MAPLPPRRVIAVVMDDKAPDTVVLRLNSAHPPKVTPGMVTPKHLRRSLTDRSETSRNPDVRLVSATGYDPPRTVSQPTFAAFYPIISCNRRSALLGRSPT